MSITSRINNHDRVFCLLTPPSGDQHGMGSLAHRAVTTPCGRGLERERGESELQRGGVKAKPRLRPKRAAVLFRHEKKGAGLAFPRAFAGGGESLPDGVHAGSALSLRGCQDHEHRTSGRVNPHLPSHRGRGQIAGGQRAGVCRAQSARWGSLPALHPSRPALRKPRRPVALLVRDRIVFFFSPKTIVPPVCLLNLSNKVVLKALVTFKNIQL